MKYKYVIVVYIQETLKKNKKIPLKISVSCLRFEL